MLSKKLIKSSRIYINDVNSLPKDYPADSFVIDLQLAFASSDYSRMYLDHFLAQPFDRGAFSWADTPQGSDFWLCLCKEVRENREKIWKTSE